MRSSRKYFPIVGLAIAILAASAPLSAQSTRFGLRASAWVEDSDPSLGLEALVPFSRSDWAFNPNAEVVFGGDRDRFLINLDVTRTVRREASSSLWLGGGLAWIHRDANRSFDAENDAGLNLLAGIDWHLRGWTPYAQVKVVASDDAELVASVGLRF